MAEELFRDRSDAGRTLGRRLEHYRGRNDVVVLAIPRGGVPVGYEVATALGAPLDVFIVRKLGVPHREELAMGAIATGGALVLNDEVVCSLGIPAEVIERVALRERAELERRDREYRQNRPPPDVTGRTVLLVDDGLATGSSMRVAVLALRRWNPAWIVVAVPAAPEATCAEMADVADEVVCATMPVPFRAVGMSYADFTQVTDDEVRQFLRAGATAPPSAGG